MPKRVIFTRAALEEPFGQRILGRVEALGLAVERLKGNRLSGLRGGTDRETYRRAKATLAVVTAPPSLFRLRPVPPSADYQFHLAQGCPAHCQYCYLAGSLSGPPVTRVYANLPQILHNLEDYERPGRVTTFEASCYTDPLAIEHLTGALAETIRHFGRRPPTARLRWVTKFGAVEPLLGLPHGGRTRCRVSVNAPEVERRFEGGTDPVDVRLEALRRLALSPERGGGGYAVGLVVAPIMPYEGWEGAYADLLDRAAAALDFPCNLTFELITHRFTPHSKETLQSWYPASALEMDETARAERQNKYGGRKYVYRLPVMRDLRGFFEREIARRFPDAPILYWV